MELKQVWGGSGTLIVLTVNTDKDITAEIWRDYFAPIVDAIENLTHRLDPAP